MELYDLEEYDMNTIKGILYFLDKCNEKMYTTKLDKLLFLAQGTYLKEYRKKLFREGFMYDYPGPKMINLEKKYLTVLALVPFIKIEQTDYGKAVIPNTSIYDNEYANEEKTVYNKILNKYSQSTAFQIYHDLDYLKGIFKVKEKIKFEKCLDYFD